MMQEKKKNEDYDDNINEENIDDQPNLMERISKLNEEYNYEIIYEKVLFISI